MQGSAVGSNISSNSMLCVYQAAPLASFGVFWFIFGLASLGLDAFKIQLPEQACMHHFYIFPVEKGNGT